MPANPHMDHPTDWAKSYHFDPNADSNMKIKDIKVEGHDVKPNDPGITLAVSDTEFKPFPKPVIYAKKSADAVWRHLAGIFLIVVNVLAVVAVWQSPLPNYGKMLVTAGILACDALGVAIYKEHQKP